MWGGGINLGSLTSARIVVTQLPHLLNKPNQPMKKVTIVAAIARQNMAIMVVLTALMALVTFLTDSGISLS